MNEPTPEKLMAANGIELAFQTFGNPLAKPLVLIMGLGAQMILWDEEFCSELADHGFWVIRFDNRDIGRSGKLDDHPVPDLSSLLEQFLSGQPIDAPYRLSDMAQDTVGLMDGLGIRSAHVVGASMGGAIAQEMAIRHPHRVRSLTSIMATTGHPGLPLAKPEAVAVLLRPPAVDWEGYLKNYLNTWKVLSGPKFPSDERRETERARRNFARGLSPSGAARQFAAILASGSRKERLRQVGVPTLVIHGDADPLVPVECGVDTAHSIPGAHLMVIEGMGHTLPVALWPKIIDAIARHAGQA
jgi:pimeloyl-ACP methyl ester carboxylesterase